MMDCEMGMMVRMSCAVLCCIVLCCAVLWPIIEFVEIIDRISPSKASCPGTIGDIPCSGHGICDSFGVCTCDVDWIGSGCNIGKEPPPLLLV